MTRILLSSVAAAAVLASASTAFAQTEIQFWHAMGGNLGDTVNALAEGFNKSQKEYKVNPVYKGSYTETLTAAIAAFRAKQAPHIVQVFEVGTGHHDGRQGRRLSGLPADGRRQGAVRSVGLSSPRSTAIIRRRTASMLSMPFNSSTPVMYYNKDASEGRPRSGVPPKTWPSWARSARRSGIGAGAKCGFTTSWQTWVQIENLRRLAQSAVRHAGERLRRHRHRAEVQRPGAGQAFIQT
jgi:sn-glycerol 3-phosphate transport system substrate-binding protein